MTAVLGARSLARLFPSVSSGQVTMSTPGPVIMTPMAILVGTIGVGTMMLWQLASGPDPDIGPDPDPDPDPNPEASDRHSLEQVRGFADSFPNQSLLL